MFIPNGYPDPARGRKAGTPLQILWPPPTAGVEDVTAARGAPIWYQLYASNSWDVAKALVARAEKAGCPVVAVTVDRNGGRNQETLFPLRAIDDRNCHSCHDPPGLTPNQP